MSEARTEYGGRTGKSTICVDGAAEGYGSRADDNPAVAYLMKATCEFLPCPLMMPARLSPVPYAPSEDHHHHSCYHMYL